MVNSTLSQKPISNLECDIKQIACLKCFFFEFENNEYLSELQIYIQVLSEIFLMQNFGAKGHMECTRNKQGRIL